MKKKMIHIQNPNSIQPFLSINGASCDSRGIAEGVELWFFCYFTRGTSAAALSGRLALQHATFCTSY